MKDQHEIIRREFWAKAYIEVMKNTTTPKVCLMFANSALKDFDETFKEEEHEGVNEPACECSKHSAPCRSPDCQWYVCKDLEQDQKYFDQEFEHMKKIREESDNILMSEKKYEEQKRCEDNGKPPNPRPPAPPRPRKYNEGGAPILKPVEGGSLLRKGYVKRVTMDIDMDILRKGFLWIGTGLTLIIGLAHLIKYFTK